MSMSTCEQRHDDTRQEPTLIKVGQGIVCFDIGLRLVGSNAHRDEIFKGGLELIVKLDGLGHGKVVEFVGEHDGTTLCDDVR